MSTDVSAEGFGDVPVDAIKLLIDMIRGVTEFNAIRAIRATLEVAKWAIGMFGVEEASTTACQKDEALVLALGSLLPGEEGDVHAATLPFPREVLVEMLLKWLFNWLNNKLNK